MGTQMPRETAAGYDEVRFTAVEELRALLGGVDSRQVQDLVESIDAARSVFVAGAGRSGLSMRAFAMRLMHMGIAAHVVGEITAPAFAPGDILVVGSGSGATPTLVALSEKAKKLGGRLALLTTDPASPIGRAADVIVRIPAPTPKAARRVSLDGPPGADEPTAAVPSSVQPMASLFEQGLWILLDSCIMLLMTRKGVATGQMFSRHANLE
jgi:6-phospho-3-hexuloisomerase